MRHSIATARRMLGCAVFAAAATVTAGAASAQSDDLAKYHAMLSDPFANPGWFAVDRGEVLWSTPAGPKNATLEDCDLGLGPGVVDGAYAQMPRYFADADRVMDADTRIAWCREALQGIPFAQSAKTAFSRKNEYSEMQDLTAYVAAQSEGMPLAPPMAHPREVQAAAIGEALFHRRGSMLDYSCATCHGHTGARIRLQELSNLTEADEAGAVMVTWPTFRVSHETVRTMQHRMWDCQWQMRMPDIAFGSEASVALISYLTRTGAGAEMASPGLKR